MSLAIISPNNFAFSYFNEPGYTAVIRGEVVHVAKCTPVFVVPRHNTGEHCYNELAVECNNKTMYVTPRSRILIPNGQLVSCSSEVGPMYKLNGKWVTQTNVGLIPSRNPSIIEMNPISYEFEPLENLVNGGIYSPSIMMEYQKILTSPMEESVIKSRIVSAVIGIFESISHIFIAKNKKKQRRQCNPDLESGEWIELTQDQIRSMRVNPA